MKATTFAYWLQGYFEITEKDSAFTEAQAKTVLAKVKNVKAGTTSIELESQKFVSYIEGALSAVYYVSPNSQFLAAATADIKSKLNDLFVHAIDPSIEGDQEGLHKIHRPRKTASDIEIMC